MQASRMGSRARWASLGTAAALALAAGAPARADSALTLPYPVGFGAIPASTYDAQHMRVGGAMLSMELLESGIVRMVGTTGIDGGARTVVRAELEPVEGTKGLRLVSQESQSINPDGLPLGVLRVDHRTRKGSCTMPDPRGGSRTEEIALPEGDRVVNVPLNLLFLPLVRGEVDATAFQLFLCRGGPRLLDAEARMAKPDGTDPHLREVVYGPDFGMLSRLAGGLLPHFSFWFDDREPHGWMAHHLPLYAKGPEVFVVRDGVPASWLAH